ncbi:recombinase family protein [Paenibacillus sp. FSL K6-2393]|uniref:recombinase family protein n=1 Tax=Paenibacillus sp. FSL K6-2393 TaxID=2921475 RepID=UPI0030FC415A
MKVVVYLRVSSEQQSERQLSIPAQRAALESYASERGWQIVDEYLDEAKSAKSDDRPDFLRMIDAAKKPYREFQVILVHKFDRFSRSSADHTIYKALLKKLGISVISASEPTETDTPHGMLLEGMLEVISEFYNVNLKHETLKGMKENAIQGFHCGGRAPFGYRLVRTGRKVNYELGPDEEVKVIKQIFRMAAEGMGGKKIARILNEQGIPTGRKWLPSTILSILNNEAYLGNRVWNKKMEMGSRNRPQSEWIVSENSHPAIIENDLWIRAQSQLSLRKKNLSI